jgi:hypothetical protein
MGEQARECRHCHRPIRDPESVAAGAGPDCRAQRPDLYPPKRRRRSLTPTPAPVGPVEPGDDQPSLLDELGLAA